MKHWGEMASRWHEDYERGRPGYPASALRILEGPGSQRVLELGAGTGKLTRRLLGAQAEVVAVEPDPGMRRWLATTCPGAVLVGGTAEAVPLADHSVDAVVSAEAFHWFAHDRALVEVARVLRPDGQLVLLWNRPAGPIVPPIAAVERLLEPRWPDGIEMPLDLDARRFPYARDWPNAFTTSVFEPLHETVVANPHVVDRDGLVAYFASMGWISELADDERSLLLDELRSQLDATTYSLPFATHVYSTRLRLTA